MRIFLSSLAVLGALSATAAFAQDNKVVVELYTSQGCSSCPPADALLADLVGRDDVIPLALHVDYWDYLGWKDEFGSRDFTARQHGYARAANVETVYTPQMVIAGTDHVIGSKAMAVMDHIAAQRAQTAQVGLNAVRDGQYIKISATPHAAGLGAMVVQLVHYHPEETVAIRRGENAGKSISYVNIVTSWQVIGRWDGTSPLTMNAAVEGSGPAVIVIQKDQFGPILAAVDLP